MTATIMIRCDATGCPNWFMTRESSATAARLWTREKGWERRLKPSSDYCPNHTNWTKKP